MAQIRLPTPTLQQRLVAAVAPIRMILVVLYAGLLPAAKIQLSSLSLALLSPSIWWGHILSFGFPAILQSSDEESHKVKRALMLPCKGSVLEIGAGAGHNVKYYPVDQITSILAIEPFVGMHVDLKAAVQAAGLTSKYTIAPISISDDLALSKYGIEDEKFDTVVCIQVLCSVPDPKELIPKMQSWLKPGGSLILYEHVASDDGITRVLQSAWTKGCWRGMFLGCEMDRTSDVWLRELGGWKEVKIGPGEGETGALLYPHAKGVLVKA